MLAAISSLLSSSRLARLCTVSRLRLCVTALDIQVWICALYSQDTSRIQAASYPAEGRHTLRGPAGHRCDVLVVARLSVSGDSQYFNVNLELQLNVSKL